MPDREALIALGDTFLIGRYLVAGIKVGGRGSRPKQGLPPGARRRARVLISIPPTLSRPHPPLCLRPGHGASPSSRVSIAPPARPPAILTMSDTGPIPVLVSSAELTRTFGVLLIGFIFSVVLYGLTFFRASSIDCSRAFASHTAPETYIYFTRFPSDHFATKAVVSGPPSRVHDPRPHPYFHRLVSYGTRPS